MSSLTLDQWKTEVSKKFNDQEVVFLEDKTGELPPGSIIAVPKGGESLAEFVSEDLDLFGYFDLTTGIAMVDFDDEYEAIA